MLMLSVKRKLLSSSFKYNLKIVYVLQETYAENGKNSLFHANFNEIPD